MTIIENNRGFSLVSVLVAVGLLGTVAMFVVNLNQQQVKNSKNAETKNELIALHAQINQYLLDGDACSETFSPPFVLSGTSRPVPNIFDGKGNVKFSENTPYGNNTVKINSITLTPVAPATNLTLANNSSKEMRLTFVYQKISNLTAKNTLTKTVDVKVQRDASGNIICYSQLSNAIDEAVKQSCISLGGTYDTSQVPNCKLPQFVKSNVSISCTSAAGITKVINLDAVPSLTITTLAPSGDSSWVVSDCSLDTNTCLLKLNCFKNTSLHPAVDFNNNSKCINYLSSEYSQGKGKFLPSCSINLN